jgi:aspartate racemase
MRKIGLIGGMSWKSTRIYYDAINRGVQARLGGLHSADLLIASLDFAPVAAMQAAGEWEAAGDLLVRTAKDLERAGAGCIALATNTMHTCAPAVTAAIGVPFVHIGDALAAALARDGRTRPLLLGTRFTMEDGFLSDRLRAHGLAPMTPDAAGRTVVHETIYAELCRGIVSEPSRLRFLEIIADGRRRGADSVILGCTEIVMLIAPDSASLPGYDTTALHAAALVDFALAETGA